MKKLKSILLSLILPLSSIGQVAATYNEVVSKSKKGSIDTYTTQSGEFFSVGDTLTLGSAFRNESFDYISQYAVVGTYPLLNTQSGSRVIIKSIRAQSGNVLVITTKPQGLVYGLIINNFEGAINNGEIRSKLITSDQALDMLKKCKDKFDLGLITEEEYNQRKSELAKLIK